MKLAFFKLSKWIVIFAVLLITIFFLGGCSPTNHPPLVTSIEAKQSIVGPLDSCLIECVAWDEDGDELSYEWSAGKGDINGDGATVAWTAPETEGIYNIMVRVTDGNGGEATGSVTIEVKDNHPPTISLIADADWVTPSSSCRIECDAEDPDGDELNYEWSTDGGDISGTGSVVIWTAPDTEGLYTITVVVSDGYGGEDTGMLTISVAVLRPPIIKELVVTAKEPKYLDVDSGVYRVLKGKSYDIECVAFDPNGDELSYELLASGDKIDGGEISGEGSMITWTAPDGAVEVTVTVTVSDAAGNMVSKSIVFTVETCSACAF